MLMKLKIAGWIALLFVTTAQAEPVVLVMGDSLSAEYGLPTGSGWPTLLQQRLLRDGYRYRVANASISGETSIGGRTRIRDALATHRPAVVILALGANDGLRGQPVNLLRANLQAIIEACRAKRASVLLVGMRLPPNYGTKFSHQFEAAFSLVAERTATPLVPFMLAEFETDRTLFQQDGLHPVAAAQSRIVDNVYPKLQSLLKK
jgi:acyl-CoA thioesterase-1